MYAHLQNCPFAYWDPDRGPPSITWLLVPTRAHIPNGISIVSAVFAGFIPVTYTQTHTDRPPHNVCSNTPHLYAMHTTRRSKRSKQSDKTPHRLVEYTDRGHAWACLCMLTPKIASSPARDPPLIYDLVHSSIWSKFALYYCSNNNHESMKCAFHSFIL